MSGTKELAAWLDRLGQYACLYVPGPRWSEGEAANRAGQAHLDARLAEALATAIEERPEAWASLAEWWRAQDE